MPPRNPKSVLYTVKNTISPDKKRTCLEMKNIIFQFFEKIILVKYQVGIFLGSPCDSIGKNLHEIM